MNMKHDDGIRELTPDELDQVSGGLPSLGDAVTWAANKLGLGGVVDDLKGAWNWLTGLSFEVRGGRGPERPL